jgi:hypothetical protein
MLYDGFWATGAIAPPLNYKTLRHIVGVPNHVRAWSRRAYLELGGHARGLPVADDYDLVLRTVFKYPAVYVRHMTYIQVSKEILTASTRVCFSEVRRERSLELLELEQIMKGREGGSGRLTC